MLSKVFLVFGIILSLNFINIDDYMRFDDISIYRERLDEFNEAHNTNYTISNEPLEGNLEDQIEFFTSMTLKEFDEYILSLYQLDMANPDPAKSEFQTNDNSFKYKPQSSKSNFIIDMIKTLPVRDEKFSAVYLD